MAADTKDFTEKQKARLPDDGYIVARVDSMWSAYCIKNGEIFYYDPEFHGNTWNYLTWTCCPTRKMIAGKGRDKTDPTRYMLFKTQQELAENLGLVGKMPRSPNDP